MCSAREYRARADRIMREVPVSPPRSARRSAPLRWERLRQLDERKRELRRVKVELWARMHRIRMLYLRRRLRAATGAWSRTWAVWSRAWLRYEEAATLTPYHAAMRRIDAHLARIDEERALVARSLARHSDSRSAPTPEQR